MRAGEVAEALSPEEKVGLTLGLMAVPRRALPASWPVVVGAGFVPGVPRLEVPPLRETDASLGVSWLGGARGDGATALPSGIAQGATWDPELVRRGGGLIAKEAKAKGYNVLLAGGLNLMREPRGGRGFEYFGEDPWLSGVLAGSAVQGIQSEGVISTVKHFAINPQETGRHFMNVDIDEASLRESDLLAFQIAIERGQPGAVMCAYNRLNGPLSCGSRFLLTDVLRRDWGYRGFVMSDWGAVEALDFAWAGLDQQSGAQLDEGLFFGRPLLEAAKSEDRYAERLEEMARRVLFAIYSVGIEQLEPGASSFDARHHAEAAREVAEASLVLLKNEDVLPLGEDVRSVAVIGGYADRGTLSGGGSSRVVEDGGPAARVPFREGAGPGWMIDPIFHRSSPLAALRARAPATRFEYVSGRYPSEAAAAAKRADVALVFVTQYQTEGWDVPDLSLPDGQDALIAAVAKANPETVVVLETGGPVLMPWLEAVSGALEAWYPGTGGGAAIASVLYGDVNPSGHLPVTFPASLAQLPRPKLDGLGEVVPSFVGKGAPGQTLEVSYRREGSDVGYRWYAREGLVPLFPFGFGLSYSRFEHVLLEVKPDGASVKARMRVKNVGDRSGADVVQLYRTTVGDRVIYRLAGFERVQLDPGEARELELDVDSRLLAEWEDGGWTVPPGPHSFAVGEDAGHLGEARSVEIEGARLDPDGSRRP